MAQRESWIISDDGTLVVGEELSNVTYHGGINVLLVSTKAHTLKVIDVPSGIVLRDCSLSGLRNSHDGIQCHYVDSLDRVLYCNGRALGIRKDLSGVLLVDTALQTPVTKSDDPVHLELLFPEAKSLLNSLLTAELNNVDYVEDVLRELEKEVEAVRLKMRGNHKQSKWSAVCLKLPHCALKTVCQSLVEELKRQNDRKPGLSTAAAIYDRLQALLPKSETDNLSSTPNGIVDRGLMYNELARRETFSKWPHMSYKWALPAQMAQAGFYHQPAGAGDDRALCFTCNVCLVHWEPTDEPWSEHERHSPQCPFVRGEITHNVPCDASYATEPAHHHGNETSNVHIECISTTSCSDFIASSSIHGNIVVWDTSSQLKKHIEFNVDPWESIIASKTGTGSSVHMLEPPVARVSSGSFTSAADSLSAAVVAPSSDQADDSDSQTDDETDAVQASGSQGQTSLSQSEGTYEVVLESGPKPPSAFSSSSGTIQFGAEDVQVEEQKGKAEVIEVGGAWKVTLKEHSAVETSVEGDIVAIPLENVEKPKNNAGVQQKRCRPSQDVLVSALCILQKPGVRSQTSARPCLVNGVAIRRHTGEYAGESSSTVQYTHGNHMSHDSEVQALNQVNQAITEDSQAQIIAAPHETNAASKERSQPPLYASSSGACNRQPNPFVSYLLVHDISSIINSQAEDDWRRGAKSVGGGGGKAATSYSKWSDVNAIWKPVITEPDSQGVSVGQKMGQGAWPSLLDDSEDDDHPSMMEMMASKPPTSSQGTKNVAASASATSLLQYNNILVCYPDTSSKHPVSAFHPTSQAVSSAVAKASVRIAREGQVLQCIELPNQIGTDLYVSSITTTADGAFVVVVMAPRCLNRKLELLSTNQPVSVSRDSVGDDVESETILVTDDNNSSIPTYTRGGYLLLYKVVVANGAVMLSNDPEVISDVLPNVSDAVIHVSVLPPEVAQTQDDDSEVIAIASASSAIPTSQATSQVYCKAKGVPEGQIVVTRIDGRVQILDISDFSVLTTIEGPNKERFMSTSYCSGIERLCCCTREGKLYFYSVRPGLERPESVSDAANPLEASPSKSEDQVGAAVTGDSAEPLLARQPLSWSSLRALHELTQYTPLVPRYSATVPQCWHEIQQEQQQRRHPQHLHPAAQHGEATQHTRSWRLQQDSTSWDEHVFELVLPRPSSVGHVDIKFSLHPMCMKRPNIMVTLYKQKSSNFGHHLQSEDMSSEYLDRKGLPVDSKIDFRLGGEDNTGITENTTPVRKTCSSQLQEDCAEIVCGPIDLAKYIDVSGYSGILTLTSPQLLKIKTKTLFLHLKAVVPPKSAEPVKEKGSSNGRKEHKVRVPTAAGSADKLPDMVVQRLDNVRGCDWLNEISVTIRRSKPTTILNARAQRVAMLDCASFHEQLLLVARGVGPEDTPSVYKEHMQLLAMSLLSWVLSLQLSHISTKRSDPVSVISTIERSVSGLVRTVYMESGRSVAHHCTKLLSQCLDQFNHCSNPNLTPPDMFTRSVHSALLEHMPLIPTATSAGALRWFFVLLNRVKYVDPTSTGQLCINLLTSAAEQYSQRRSHLHALLKTRYGLYGHPFDAQQFDVEPPAHSRVPSGGSQSYASIVGSGGGGGMFQYVGPPMHIGGGVYLGGEGGGVQNAAAAAAAGGGGAGNNNNNTQVHHSYYMVTGVDSKELLGAGDKGGVGGVMASLMGRWRENIVSRHVGGLLEVEPLNFTVHATSDGTKVERLDSGGGSSSGGPSGVSVPDPTLVAPIAASVAGAGGGTLNFSDSLGASSVLFKGMLKTYSSKAQAQKLKLEQKLAESTPKQFYNAYNWELFPPTPKNTPFGVTPPLTPPNEVFVNMDTASGKPSTSSKSSSGNDTPVQPKPPVVMANVSHLFQAPPAQALVVERISHGMSSLPGARRYVVLDFGTPVLLTDVLIPACQELASLSIDVWLHAEETDGQRLVVTSDIGTLTLSLTDLSPPLACRYLKITTVGKYGGNATKSKIPLGSFYGHTFMLPWESQDVSQAEATGSNQSDKTEKQPSQTMTVDQSHILSQVGVYIALLEDIQCRYGLACNRLASLLTAVESLQLESTSSHVHYYLKKNKKPDEDNRINQAYNECMNLQLQLNVAHRAIERLQRALGIQPFSHITEAELYRKEGRMEALTAHALKHAGTDQLRVLCELLLECVVNLTVPPLARNGAIKAPPPHAGLYASLTPALCEDLFKHLCVHGSSVKMSVYGGLLLVRVCGNQPWWGRFLGAMLQQYFTAEQAHLFPQDRVFILLVALGLRALKGERSSGILDSLLSLLASILDPLLGSSALPGLRSLDLTLVGWLLLFLSKCLDQVGQKPTEDAAQKGAACAKEMPVIQNRWEFVQGEAAMQSMKASSKLSASKLYRRKLQRRLIDTKQQLHNFQKAKAALDAQEKLLLEKAEKSVLEKSQGFLKSVDSCLHELDHHEALKQQLKNSKESLLKQYSSKHFKEALNLRKSDGETLRRLAKSGDVSGSDKDGGSASDLDPTTVAGREPVTIARERCIPVIRGLVALLLSMDFTCNVDLFIIATKVLARITQLPRPALWLGEVLTQQQLEQLAQLLCNSQYNSNTDSWGGAWAGHAVTCLLQDILEGERLSPSVNAATSLPAATTGLTDDEVGAALVSAAMSETDESLPNSTTLPSMADEDSGSSPSSLSNVASKENLVSEAEQKDLADDIESFSAAWPTQQKFLSESAALDECDHIAADPISAFMNSVIHGKGGSSSQGSAVMKVLSEGMPYGVGLPEALGVGTLGPPLGSADYLLSRPGACPGQAVSNAVDVRLENGLDLPASINLRYAVTLEGLRLHYAMSARIPPPPSQCTLAPTGSADLGEELAYLSTGRPQTDDEQISQAAYRLPSRPAAPVPSGEMLSACFNNLFLQLPLQRINLDALLQMWLTLNEETTQDLNGVLSFEPSRTPSIALSGQAVSSLLNALSWATTLPVSTWVLAFQVLTLVLNQKTAPIARDDSGALGSGGGGGNVEPACIAAQIVAHGNLMDVLLKFLSGTAQHGTAQSLTQVGPTATKYFYLLLMRLKWRSPVDTLANFKQLLLKLLCTLCSDSQGGALQRQVGPRDAQCRLVEYMTEELEYDPGSDDTVNNALGVIVAITRLVHQHILSQDRVLCKNSSSESGRDSALAGPSRVLAMQMGLESGEEGRRGAMGDCSRETLLCSLLKLVNMLIALPLPSSGSGGGARRRATGSVDGPSSVAGSALDASALSSPLTDTSKISQAFGEMSGLMTSTPTLALSDEEKRQQTDENEEAGSTNLSAAPVSCSHFKDVSQPEPDPGEGSTLGHIVLSRFQIIVHLIQALSSCDAGNMSLLLLPSGGDGGAGGLRAAEGGLSAAQDTLLASALLEPISVGDGIYQILCALNRCASGDLTRILKPLYDYFGASLPDSIMGRQCRLSEPLLLFLLRVLDCPHSIRVFINMGGVELVCSSLVWCSQHVINTAPSLVSAMMSTLNCAAGTGPKAGQAGAKRQDADNTEALSNFAPLGTVSSSNPNTGSTEILIAHTPPHRRARSAPFSYYFRPDELWMDITISLPCSIVLREVHIQPHTSSLATCPAAVTLEISRDGLACVPLCAPLSTSGFTAIKLQLLKPEVASAVTVRLHRPLDSSTLGLSQIKLLGTAAFAESGGGGGSGPGAWKGGSGGMHGGEDAISKTSVGWLCVLHHCLTQCDEVVSEVAAAAAPTQHLLPTCTAMLLSPAASQYNHKTEQVLLKLGLHSEELGLCLLDHLLRGRPQRHLPSSRAGPGLPTMGATSISALMHGHRAGHANESTVDILYQLGVTQDAASEARVRALRDWLEHSALSAIQREETGSSASSTGTFMASPGARASPGHVFCIAAILWHSNTCVLAYDLPELLSESLLSVMYRWSQTACDDTALRQAIDAVLCSMCFVKPQFFVLLLDWTGVFHASTVLTDDSKDERRHLGPLTDDSKASNEAQDLSQQPITDDQAASRGRHSSVGVGGLAGLNYMCLDEAVLSTLALACQSPQALGRLLDTGLLSHVCQAVLEFCSLEMTKYVDALIMSGQCGSGESMTDANKMNSPRGLHDGVVTGLLSNSDAEASCRMPQPDSHRQQANEGCVKADQASRVLRFLSEVAMETGVKDWLGAAENSEFWTVLLSLLCCTPTHLAAPLVPHARLLGSAERAQLETETINFFKQVVNCYPENQLRFAYVLCDVMQSTGLLGEGAGGLTGFMRRLFLQVLLEDERVLVSIYTPAELGRRPSNSFSASASTDPDVLGGVGGGAAVGRHPRCGAGHKYRTLSVSVNSTCAEILAKITEAAGLNEYLDRASQTAGATAADRNGGPSSAVDITAAQMVDNIMKASNLTASSSTSSLSNSKPPLPPPKIIPLNAKSSSNTYVADFSTTMSKMDSLPPRPPSRRGFRSEGVGGRGAGGAGTAAAAAFMPRLCLFHPTSPDQPLPERLTLAQLGAYIQRVTPAGASDLHAAAQSDQSFLALKMKLRSRLIEDAAGSTDSKAADCVLLEIPSAPSALHVFASIGGLSLLAEHLPILYPEVSRLSLGGDEMGANGSGKTNPPGASMLLGHEWVTIDSTDELYDDMYDVPPLNNAGGAGGGGIGMVSDSAGHPGRKSAASGVSAQPNLPPHSLVAFGVFLRLPGYAEVLLKEQRKAQYLLRLVLGVTDDGQGGHILHSAVAPSLPTLPFTVLRTLCDVSPLTTDDGVLLRRMALDIGVVHLLLGCLSVLSHHAPRKPMTGAHQELVLAVMQSCVSNGATATSRPEPPRSTALYPVAGSGLGGAGALAGAGVGGVDEKGVQYWAKGTGFGTGSTISSWDAEQALLRQRSEEEHVTCLIQVLASFIHPGDQVLASFLEKEDENEADEESERGCGRWALPAGFCELLTDSCLVPAICAYLRNDSVLDMSRHILLYRALLKLLRALAVCPPLGHLLLPLGGAADEQASPVSIAELLDNMRACVDTYASRLKSNKGKSSAGAGSKSLPSREDVEDSEGLALLIPDIQSTASTVHGALERLQQKHRRQDELESLAAGAARLDHSLEDKYLVVMKRLQFDTYEMVLEDDKGAHKFTMPYHYESNVKSAGDVNNAARARRLAQEAVTLSTSLPLSYNSTVFARCDEERLDVMKVLITGPSDTPYANGCFEFDVYFPQDYPNSPPQVNLETTGNKTVRFNPNLYNDGKVCLSVLNTWHGRPEEKWNAQTSSFLQVLVSIQSLILVSEPYFNEPGYERSRGTPSGTASSHEYDANIRQATVKWALLEMLRNPPACFKQVIQSHMWVKRVEICAQVEGWISEMEAFSTDKRTGRSIAHSLVALKRHYSQLKEEFAKMKVPPDFESDGANSANGHDMDASGPSSGNYSLSNTPHTSASCKNSKGATSTSTQTSTPQQASNTSSSTNGKVKSSSSSNSGVTNKHKQPDVESGHVKHANSHAQPLLGNHVGSGSYHPYVTAPVSNGEVAEDVASMFLGPEEEHGATAALNLQQTDDIYFL